MESQSKQNVLRRRKAIQRRRRIKFFRLFILLVIMLTVLTGIGWLSMKLYQWGSATYATYSAIYEDFQQRRALRAASFDPRFDGYTNILVIGLDPGKEDTGPQADSLTLLSFRHEDGALRIINIPRYTLVDISGIQQPERINNAYYYGGVKLLEQTVAKLLGVTVHHYVAIDTEAFKEMVDVLGGIDVYVETEMNYEDPEGELYIHIPKGFQHMDGETAQQYLRFTSDDLGAYGRGKRQQAFMKALYNRMLQPDMAVKLPLLMDVWQRRVDSTIEGFDSPHFANIVRKLSGVVPETILLPGGWDQYGSWVCDQAALDAKMLELFPPEPEPEATTWTDVLNFFEEKEE